MGMSYSKNPDLPKVRAEAVRILRSIRSTREGARGIARIVQDALVPLAFLVMCQALGRL